MVSLYSNRNINHGSCPATARNLHVTPLIKLELPDKLKFAAPLVNVFVFDFFYYWLHRFQHRYRFLWQFHEPHHRIEELNSLNCNHHLLEEAFRFLPITLPLSFFSIPIEHSLPIFALLPVWGHLIHANTIIGFGFLRFLFTDSAYHRLHHSIESQHYDKNFAAFFPIYDVVFGTSYFPKKDEKIKTGIQSKPEAKSFKEFYLNPFTYKSNRKRARETAKVN